MKNKFLILSAVLTLTLSLSSVEAFKNKKYYSDDQVGMSTGINCKHYLRAPITQNAHKFRKNIINKVGISNFKNHARNKTNLLIEKLPFYANSIKSDSILKNSLGKRVAKALYAKKNYQVDDSNASARKLYKANEKVRKAFPKIDDGSGFGYTIKNNGDIALTEYKSDINTVIKKLLNLPENDDKFFDKMRELGKELSTPIKEDILISQKDLK